MDTSGISSDYGGAFHDVKNNIAFQQILLVEDIHGKNEETLKRVRS